MFFEKRNKKFFFVNSQGKYNKKSKKAENPLTNFLLFDIIMKIREWEGVNPKWKATIVKTETDALLN